MPPHSSQDGSYSSASLHAAAQDPNTFDSSASHSTTGSSWVITSGARREGDPEFPFTMISPSKEAGSVASSSVLQVEDDDLTEASQSSYWEEEAHWMSFHNAIAAVAQRTPKRNQKKTARVMITMMSPKSVAENLSPYEIKESSDDDDEDSLDELLADLTLSRRRGGQDQDSSKCVEEDMLKDNLRRIAALQAEMYALENSCDFSVGSREYKETQKAVSETRRKLAMGEAERDALEVAFMQRTGRRPTTEDSS